MTRPRPLHMRASPSPSWKERTVTDVSVHRKNWLVLFTREVQQSFDSAAAERAVEPFTSLPLEDRIRAWCDEALHRRGLLVGAPTPCWRPHELAAQDDRSEWLFLNLLAHQLELTSELRLLLGQGLETPADRLASLGALAANVGDLETLEALFDLSLEEWGDDQDSRRNELASALAPLGRTLGTRLMHTRFLSADAPLAGLPFHHVLRYEDTRQLIDVARLIFTAPGRPDLRKVQAVLARNQLEKIHMIEAIIGLAMADNTLTKLERRLIDSVIEMARLPDDDRELVLEAYDHPPTPKHLGAQLTDPLSRRFLYTQLELNTLLEGEPNPEERRYVDALAEAFALEEQEQLGLQGEALAFLEANPSLVDAFSLGDTLRRFRGQLTRKVEAVVKTNLGKLVTEIKETGELAQLLAKRATGNLSAEEEKKVREQLLDICRTVPSLAIFALPGGAVLLPIVLKLIPFNLLPSAFTDKEEKL
ncbi:MAG: DUF533 domain-containing protein [bacterium]